MLFSLSYSYHDIVTSWFIPIFLEMGIVQILLCYKDKDQKTNKKSQRYHITVLKARTLFTIIKLLFCFRKFIDHNLFFTNFWWTNKWEFDDDFSWNFTLQNVLNQKILVFSFIRSLKNSYNQMYIFDGVIIWSELYSQ